MAGSKVIDLEGIGPVLFEKSRRAKRVIVSVRDTGTVRVAVPHRTSFQTAQRFAEENISWIQTRLAKMECSDAQSRSLTESFKSVNRDEAKEWLKQRLAYLADKYGFKYNRVTVRSQKTRWGSCSRHHNISLNIKLVVLPGELIDYVLLHELVHTKIYNHSREFYTELDKYVDNARKTAKQLRQYRLRAIG